MLNALLYAVPLPLHTVPASKGKDGTFGADRFHLRGSSIYAIDNSSGMIRVWDTGKIGFTQLAFAKLPGGVQADDITGDANNLYILDSKNSSIYVYNTFGTLQRTISGKGTPAVQFKKALRIVVNKQGYLYVLDAGRNELLAFTNEGMFMGKAEVTAPISMSIGQDQLIRVLSAQTAYDIVQVFDASLNLKKSFDIQTVQDKKDKIADIAVNQYNELYVIYSGSTKIAKVNSEGRLISKTWGFKGKDDSPGSFLAPQIVRAFPWDADVLLAILDSKQKIIRLFKDTEFSNATQLVIPESTMRPSLEKTDIPLLLDYVVKDSLEFYIHEAVKEGSKPSRTITCKTFGKLRYSISVVDFKKQGIQSFDALAVYGIKLFVADSKSHKIFVFNKLSGVLLDSFGAKGSKEGRLNTPVSLAMTPDGYLYIAETGNSRISIFNENAIFIGVIELKDSKLVPQLIRIKGNSLYVLANGNSIYELSLANPQQSTLLTRDTKISSFDLMYENRIGYINAVTQQLVILHNGKTEHSYFAKNAKGIFPNFANIIRISYNDWEKSLIISDKGATTARKLRYIYNPVKPQSIKLKINSSSLAEIYWDVPEGISKWLVTKTGEGAPVYFEVAEPRMVIDKPQKYIASYSVSSLSLDKTLGVSTEAVEDAYSYARYLLANNNYSQAILAYKKAALTLNDPRIEEAIISCYILEAKYWTSQQEYEKALISMESAIVLGGQKVEYILETVKIYKLMKEYRQGTSYLEKFKADDNQEIQLQLISLYYFSNNYSKVQSLATAYINKFNKDINILQYLAWANENLGNFNAALANMREIVTIDDSYQNNLKIAELLIFAKENDQAMTLLQRLLNRFRGQSHDATYKLLGDVHYVIGNYPIAEDHYGNAVKQNPGKAEYYYCLANAYSQGRKSSEALSNYAKACELSPENVQYGFAYADALKKANRFTEALAVLDGINRFVATDASTTSFHELYADLLTIEQRYDDAYRELQIAVNYAPSNQTLQAKLKEATEAREYYNKNKAEVEIKAYSYQILYPSLQGYYKTHSIGSVTLFNNVNVPIQNVRIQVSAPQISDIPFVTTVQTLIANQNRVLDIVIPINRNIFTLCKDGPAVIRTELRLDYSFNGRTQMITKDNVTITALAASAMDWSNRKQFAGFVNPADENLREFVSTSVVQLFAKAPANQLNRNIQRAIQIWSFLRANGVSYVSDNTSSNAADSKYDYVQYPFQTLARKSGDCDDLLALMAAMLSVIGVDCGFIDFPGHVMLVFDSKMSFDEVMESGIEPSHFIFMNDKYWIPLETTQLGKGSFPDSWLYAIRYYENMLDQGSFPDLIEFADASLLYPPAMFSESIESQRFNKTKETLTLYGKDLENITISGQITREEEFRQAIAKYPDNLSVANQYALWCMQNNKVSMAQTLLEQILKQEPANFSALINLGNLYLDAGQYNKARNQYQSALNTNQNREMVLRNLCMLEYRQGNISKAKEYFNQLKDRNIIKNLDIKIYSDLLSQGE